MRGRGPGPHFRSAQRPPWKEVVLHLADDAPCVRNLDVPGGCPTDPEAGRGLPLGRCWFYICARRHARGRAPRLTLPHPRARTLAPAPRGRSTADLPTSAPVVAPTACPSGRVGCLAPDESLGDPTSRRHSPAHGR